jgi:hypothetical protein
MKRYTIAEIEVQETNKPIWALNGSAEVREMADVVIPIPKLNGSSVDNLFLDATWLPTCLTEQISRAQLLASTEFRKAVRSGLLILIDETAAKDYFEQEGANEEQERIDERKRRVADAMRSRGIHSDDASLIQQEGTQETNANELDPGFVIFFDALQPKSDLETLNAIRTRARFRRAEVQFMANHLAEKPRAMEFVRSLLSK